MIFCAGSNPGEKATLYISSRKLGQVYVRKNYLASEFPDNLKNKVYLLKHFERYIMDRLYDDYEYTFEHLDRTKGMDFVQKYLRMKHVIVFKMSHDVLHVSLPSLCVVCSHLISPHTVQLLRPFESDSVVTRSTRDAH